MDLVTVLLCLVAVPLTILVLILFSDCDLTLAFAEHYGKPKSSLRGKVVWIVGASSGIGEYLAYECAASGAKVVLSARRTERLEKVKAQCLVVGEKSGITGSDVLILPLDIAQRDSHSQSFQEVLQHFGSLDILVNNAGRSQRAAWESIEMQVDLDLFDCNVFGPVNLSRVVMPYFLERKKGHIAITSSVCGKIGAPFSASYDGTKFALHGYFDSCRNELTPKGIVVTMLCPGPVFSEILDGCATGKAGQALRTAHKGNDKRMSTERCAHLSAVAIANDLSEAWISINPVLLVLYLCQYLPSIGGFYLSRMSARQAMKLRDNRDDLVNEQKTD